MIYITGDTHRQFERIERFCEKMRTTSEDIMIILGDAGINYYGGSRDRWEKQHLAKLPITLFCIHGNHEMRPESIGTYEIQEWCGGRVYIEKEYPTLIFAIDGEIFDLDRKKTLVVGGAYSVDKFYRLAHGYHWFSDEQPSNEVKRYVEEQLDRRDWKVDVVLSHTTPLKYEPVEVFLPFIDQSSVDKSTEQWLGAIESRLMYEKWYCGHYHTEKTIDKVRLMFESIEDFSL